MSDLQDYIVSVVAQDPQLAAVHEESVRMAWIVEADEIFLWISAGQTTAGGSSPCREWRTGGAATCARTGWSRDMGVS